MVSTILLYKRGLYFIHGSEYLLISLLSSFSIYLLSKERVAN